MSDIYGDTGGWHCSRCSKRGMSEAEARMHGCGGELPMPNPQPSAPREWWIDPSDELDKDDNCDIEEVAYVAMREHPRQGPLLWQSNLIHVIERSTYEALERELREQRWRNDNLAGELVAVEQKLALLQEFKTMYGMGYDLKSLDQLRKERDEAHDALKQWMTRALENADSAKALMLERDEARMHLELSRKERKALEAELDRLNKSEKLPLGGALE